MTKTIWMTAAAATAILFSFEASLQAHELGQQHYQCYDLLDHESSGQLPITLDDQFGYSEGVAGHPVRLCNPVDKNGEGIPHPDVHLVCYAIDTDPDDDLPTVTVLNQFTSPNGDVLVIGERDTLCVPSKKRIND